MTSKIFTGKEDQNIKRCFQSPDGKISYIVAQEENSHILPVVGRLSLPKSITIPEGTIGVQAWQIYNLKEEFYEFEIPIHTTKAILLVPRETFNLLRLVQPQISIW